MRSSSAWPRAPCPRRNSLLLTGIGSRPGSATRRLGSRCSFSCATGWRRIRLSGRKIATTASDASRAGAPARRGEGEAGEVEAGDDEAADQRPAVRGESGLPVVRGDADLWLFARERVGAEAVVHWGVGVGRRERQGERRARVPQPDFLGI